MRADSGALDAIKETGVEVRYYSIIYEAIDRIIHHSMELHHSVWPVLVLLTSIAVDFWRSRQLRIVAERTGSPALATDAFHFSSDIWVNYHVFGAIALTVLFSMSQVPFMLRHQIETETPPAD